MIAYLLAQQIVVLFIMMGLGALIVKAGVVKAQDSRTLSMVTIYLILPCVILKAFQIDYSPAVRDGFILAVCAAVAIHLALFAMCGALGKVFRFDPVEKGSLIYSNAGNLIVPLVTAVLGDKWVIYASAFLCVQMIFLFTHCQTMMRGQLHLDWRSLVTNVNLIAIVVGLLMFLTGLRLPSLPYEVVSGVASTIGPVSMIMLGMVLSEVRWKNVLSHRRIYLVTTIKMIVLPLAIMALLKFSGIHTLAPHGRMILLISLLAVITPSATMVTQLAQVYGRDAAYSGSINAFTTIVSIMTMPLIISLYLF